MTEIELKARNLLASCLNEWGYHQEADNVRAGDDLESYEFELRVIGQLLRFGFDTGHGHATLTPQWQPISGAPTDGTRLLGWRNEEFPFVMLHDGRDWVVDLGDTELIVEPTHWMPLPLAPGNQP